MTAAPVQPEQNDATLVRGLLRSLIEGSGRGGLTYVAQKLGMTASAARKRLFTAKNGIDLFSMRGYMLVVESKAAPDEPLTDCQQIDGIEVGKRADNSPAWRVKE